MVANTVNIVFIERFSIAFSQNIVFFSTSNFLYCCSHLKKALKVFFNTINYICFFRKFTKSSQKLISISGGT